jgi:predicted permease
MRVWAELVTDVRFTLRLFRKSVGFSMVAILSLALGIGASSAIFSLVYAVLLDPYPYRDSDRIIAPTFTERVESGSRVWYSVPDFLDIQKNSKTLENGFLADFRSFVVTGGLPEQIRGLAYSPNAFDFMGVPALLGRTFGPADIPVAAAPPNIGVISYLFWQRHFQGDPGIVGKTVELNHQPYTILGVAPPRYTWNDADIYVPLPMTPDARRPLELMARMKPGVSPAAVNAELQVMTERFAKQTPDVYPKEFKMNVQRLNDWLLGKFQGTLLILLAAVGLLLLIACGNVSILLLARAGARAKEMAVRISMGATRGRILRQLLTESVLLSCTGGLIGVLLAYRGVPAIVALMPEYSVPHEAAIQVNWAVVLFTFAVSVLTGILFGMAPAMQLAKDDVQDAMQESGRGLTGNTRTGKIRTTLIVAEVALTMILLVGAGVAIRGFISLTQVKLGYDQNSVLSMFLQLREGEYKTYETRRAHFQKMLAKLKETPGVRNVTATFTAMPPRIGWETAFEISGRTKDANDRTRMGLVSDDYFSTLRIPVLRGRTFSEAEVQRTAQVAVINEEMARRYWPGGGDPVGRTLQIPELKYAGSPDVFGAPGLETTLEIIGVVGTARNRGLREDPKPAVYVPYTVLQPPGCAYLIRTEGDPHNLVNALREQIRTVDADQTVTQVMTLDEQLARQERSYPRFSTTLFSIFAGVGLILAATGLFSVLSYIVTRRTHEFGIRMALGARGADILRLVATMTARLTMAGIVIGLIGSVALSRVIANYVEGWDPKDPAAFLGVTAVLILAAVAACWLPVRRASTVQPMSALRHE